MRSIVAVMLFLGAAVLAATYKFKEYIPHVGLGMLEQPIFPSLTYETIAKICVGAGIALIVFSMSPPLGHRMGAIQILSAIAGVIFGFGLLISGMTRRDKVNGFLDL